MGRAWSRLGGQLGFACIALGLLLILFGWYGAAGLDYDQGQIPYLISGGIGGLALVITGAALLIVQNSRRDRSVVETQLRELNATMSRLGGLLGNGSPGAGDGRAVTTRPRGSDSPVVAMGRSSFHRLDCRLAEGKDLPTGSIEAALDAGLTPCRICNPQLEPLAVPSATA